MPADNLVNLLNALTETSIYVIEEESHELLYFNRRCLDTGRGRVALGMKCHEVWPEVCTHCPLDAMGDTSSGHIICYDPIQKETVDTTANRFLWDGHIPAVLVTAAPHHQNRKEIQGHHKIEQMYAQSLVTVFNECIIVNLTADYYVNCSQDVMWSGLPEQGEFGIQNRNYASKVIHPDDLERFHSGFSREALLHCFDGGKQQISKRLRRRMGDGTYHMVEFTAVGLGDGAEDECWCVLVLRDVQDEFLTEQQKNVEISQLATAARIAYQMLIAVNLTQNTYRMLEYDRLPVGQPNASGSFNDLITAELATVHPDYQKEFRDKFSRQSLIDTYNSGGRIVTMEVPHRGEDGLYYWHFTQVVRVESPYTDDMIEITLSRNIDEERRQREEALEKERGAKQLLEDALQKAEKANRAKSDFLSKMSHDIRTPMNAILGMTELAQLHIADPDHLEDYLKKIHSSGMHLLGLINEVLDVSKIENGNFELVETNFNLRELVRDSVELVALTLEQRGQSITVEIDDRLEPGVTGDAQRLKQVLVNILDNASKYTQSGGKLSLRLKELDRGEWKAGTYRFDIADNGMGMEPEYVKHIFEPFSRAADSRTSKVIGTGLGMTIVKNLVDMMGGDIQIESEYGRGTKFSITLCLRKSDTQAARAMTKEWESRTDFTGLCVLLAEDNELNRQIATEMLKLLGVQVEIAENGRQAVDAVCSHPPSYYDLVFMDVQMPVMNGYEATSEIRNCGIDQVSDLPIVAMTADAFAEDARQARLAGMDGHLAKPISMAQLRAELSRCQVWKQTCSQT